MTTKNQDFEMYQGEKVTLVIPVIDSDGAPQPMTGASVIWRVTASKRDSTAVLDKLTSDGITIIDIDGTNDGLQITIDPADSASLPARTYYHECRVTDSAGSPKVVFEGALELTRSTTKPTS